MRVLCFWWVVLCSLQGGPNASHLVVTWALEGLWLNGFSSKVDSVWVVLHFSQTGWKKDALEQSSHSLVVSGGASEALEFQATWPVDSRHHIRKTRFH